MQTMLMMQTIFNNAPEKLVVSWGDEDIEDLGKIREKYERALNCNIHNFKI